MHERGWCRIEAAQPTDFMRDARDETGANGESRDVWTILPEN